MTMRPRSGLSMQPMRLSSVVLPLPEGPASARNSPRAIVSVTSRSAGTLTRPRRYDLLTFSREMRSFMSVSFAAQSKESGGDAHVPEERCADHDFWQGRGEYK